MPAASLQWCSFLFPMFFMCRFFFGNIVHLNSDTDNDTFEVIFDGSTVVFEDLMLAYMSVALVRRLS